MPQGSARGPAPVIGRPLWCLSCDSRFRFHEPKTDTGSRYLLLYLRERIIFQVAGVAVEFAAALGEFFRRHGVLVVHPTKGFFVKVHAFLLARFRVNRI